MRRQRANPWQMVNRAVLALFSFFLFISIPAKSDHLFGGEISWKCLPSSVPNAGKFVFQMKIYRDCNGIPGIFGSVTLNTTVPGVNSINLDFVDTNDVSPVCENNINEPHLICDNAVIGGTDTGAVQEFIYQSNPVSLPGVPPVGGWTFYWSSCCRNVAVTNLQNPASTGYTLRAKMYPYNGRNMFPCFDNSPYFVEPPKTVICTGYSFQFNHNAIDVDLDSLSYDWAQPLTSGSPGPPVTWEAGYAYDNPMPDQTEDPNNIGAAIEPLNGQISFTSYTSGAFVICTKVSAWKCGVVIAEIFRDIQIVLKTCRPLIANTTPPTVNYPPVVVAPFVDGFGNPSYRDTVVAGQHVHFSINVTDFDSKPDGSFQTLHMEPSGSQFSTDFTDSTACIWPYCATLNPDPITTYGQAVINFDFDWTTTCNHIRQDTLCRVFRNIYNFVFKVYDDFCPIPGLSLFTVTIVVVPPEPLPPPTWRCASVDDLGHVSLSWIPALDTSNIFHSWFLYRSTSENGTYSLVDTIFSAPTYLDTSVNAHNASYFYKLSTYSGCDTSFSLADFPYGDYIRTIKMDVNNSGTGYADLSWNATHNPLIPQNYLTYDIYKKVGSAPWSPAPIASVAANAGGMTFADPVTVCDDSVRYRVSVRDSSGCTSVSSIDIDHFTDILPPAIPQADSVSIDKLTGNAVLAWKQDTSPDTHAYIILHLQGGNWITIDTVLGISNTFYATSVNALSSSETFRVYAADSCWNPSAWSLEMHTELMSAELDACQSLIRLQWNSYINWPGAVNYAVYRNDNGGTYNLLTVTTDIFFDDYSIIQGHTYCYYMVAVDASSSVSRSSTSNDACVLAQIPRAPLFNYITTATVTGPDEVFVRAYADPAADVSEYKVMRSEKYNGSYEQVGTIPYTGSTQITFTDFTANTSKKSYYYRMIVTDTCGVDIDTSEVGRTILVSVARGDDFTNTVTWNDYEVWLGGVSYYTLYRSVDGIPDPVPLVANVAPGNTVYIDNIADLAFTSDGIFCYYVMAYEGVGNVYGFRDTSRSNEACAIASPIVFVPNAFMPTSARSEANSVFSPFRLFVDAESYSMRIFNRFGEEVFTSTDTQEGWDGTYKGKPVMQGVYAYFIKMKGSDGTEIERRGTVTLIR